jgi:WD40 repeat protein
VTAIAYHPTNGTDFASGELGKRPTCFIIDSTTMTKKKELKGNGIANSILAVEYSPSGNFLGILAGDQDHTCAIYETTNWACITTGKTDRSSIIDFAFKNDTEFVTTGSKHFKHYIIKGNSFRGSLGNFAKLDQRIGCCQFNGNDCLTGNINGDLYKWNGSQASMLMPKLHSRFIDAITVSENHIFTGGRDSQIKVLSKTYELLFAIDTAAFMNSINSAIRAIDLNAA